MSAAGDGLAQSLLSGCGISRPASPELPRRPAEAAGEMVQRESFELEELRLSQQKMPPAVDDDFAQLYSDEALYVKDGCTQCPPTCAATKTFLWQLTRAVFPFVLLCQLSARWCRRKLWMNEVKRQNTSKDTFVTVRLLAECATRLYHMVLVYIVLCNSTLVHNWLKSIFGSGGGTEQGAGLDLFAGRDPADIWVNKTDEPPSPYVDVALSETFYPLCVYLLLAALCAHEETSYPRRTRVEYSVETDSVLLRGVDLMKQLAAPKDRRVVSCSIDSTGKQTFGYEDTNGDLVPFQDDTHNAMIQSEREAVLAKDSPAGIVHEVADPRNQMRTF
eukprot:COSAG02_NODE_5267_length_4484_cov_40.310376_3_plen_332_part_00